MTNNEANLLLHAVLLQRLGGEVRVTKQELRAMEGYKLQREPDGDAMIFRVVKGGRYSEDVLQQVLATFREYLGQNMKITVEFVDEVAMVRTGKRLASVSKLGIDFQKAAPAAIRANGSAPR